MTPIRRSGIVDRVRTADRVIVAIIGTFCGYFAWYIATGPTLGVPLERSWAAVFVVASASCFAFEARFLNRNLLALSGASTAMAFASRAMLLVVTMALGDATILELRVQAGVVVWSTLTAAVAYIWLRVLRPLLEFRRLDG